MRKWTKEEVMFLTEHYPQLTYRELAFALDRTIKSIEIKLTDMKLVGAS